MQPTTPGGLSWPARLAYLAAGMFTGASGGTNLLYGWSKGSDLGTSYVWAAVSIGVSIVFALSWPALLRSIDAKQWTRATMVGLALLLTGSYSISAALGNAMGGRTAAAIEAKHAQDRGAKAQAKWEAAKAELDQLNAVKPGADLQSLIDAAKADMARLPATRPIAELEALMKRGCPARSALNGQAKTACPKYNSELARAWTHQRLTSRITELLNDAGRAEQRQVERKEKLKAEMDNAAADLTHTGPTKVANSDALALSVYLQGLGLAVDADRVNKLLVLLAVLCIECGGGLALAVGLALSDGRVASGGLREGFGEGASGAAATMVRQAPDIPGSYLPVRRSPKPRKSARDGLLEMVANAKGPLI
jgi:hypothetical protein